MSNQPRICERCKTDISLRRPHAKYCKPCQRAKHLEKIKERSALNRMIKNCIVCGVDITYTLSKKYCNNCRPLFRYVRKKEGPSKEVITKCPSCNGQLKIIETRKRYIKQAVYRRARCLSCQKTVSYVLKLI